MPGRAQVGRRNRPPPARALPASDVPHPPAALRWYTRQRSTMRRDSPSPGVPTGTAVWLVLLLAAPVSAQVGSDLGLSLVTSGLSSPVAVRHARDGSGRLFVVEQPGRIRVHDGAKLLEAPFLDITERVLAGGEQGLLGLDFHPSYAANGVFYVNYTRRPDGDTVVSRFTVTTDSNVADPDSEIVLLTIPQPFANHNGGDIHFGPDGDLYIGMGDGGAGGDPLNQAQDLGSLLGKMLRIAVDPTGTYTIPPGNPFVAGPGTDEIWAYGLRNPWRWSFDRTTGDLLIGDVGQGNVEEVDFQLRSSSGGENYGWPCREGNANYDPARPGCGGPYVAPILFYGHGQGDCAVVGGYRYRGSIASLQGIYLYGDYCTGKIWLATRDGAGHWSSLLWQDTALVLSSFGEDEAGEIYVTDLGGAVYRIAGLLDYGDAPAPYPTLRADDGARHRANGPFLGVARDHEVDGRPSPTATGDDANGRDDEDGVVFTSSAIPAHAASMIVTASAPGFLDAWLDLNQDHDWADPGEAIFSSQPLTAGANTLTFDVPPNAVPGFTFARFRFSSAGGLSFVGLAPDGEVEDHRLLIQGELSIEDSTVSEGDSGLAQTSFAVSLSAPSTATVTVRYATANGTAVAPSDYSVRAGTLTFNPGQVLKIVSVPVLGDRIAELDETFHVNLSFATGAVIARDQGVGTISNDDLPGVVQFGAPAYTVGEAGRSVTLVVTRTGGTAGGVSASYSTVNASATAGSDYTARSGTLRFGIDVTSVLLTIPIAGDTVDDDGESFVVELDDPTVGATLGSPSAATVSITDDDTAGSVAFSVDSYGVSEAGLGATITVRRTGGAASGVTVRYQTNGGSAKAGTDYGTTSGTLTFAHNVPIRTFTVPIKNDTVVEGDLTVLLTLSLPGGGALLGSPNAAVLTIRENDRGGAIRFSSPRYSRSEASSMATVTVARAGGVASGVTVDYATSDDTAEAGSDYDTTGGKLTFLAGQISKTLNVPIRRDAFDEANETVNLTLSNATGGATLGSPIAATLTIVDDDVGGVLQFRGARVNASEDAGTASVTVTRSGGMAGGVTVTCTPSDVSATSGADHAGVAQVLTFGAGVLSQSCTVPILEDDAVEGPETLTLTLSDPTGGARLEGRKTATLTIIDDEPATTLHFATTAGAVIEGGGALVTVQRSGPAASPVTVDYATSDGTAFLADGDYSPRSGTLRFAPNVRLLTFMVATTADRRDEANEDVNLTLSNPTGGAVLGTQSAAKLTIVDNDDGGALRFSSATYARSEAFLTATITVTRTGGTASGVTVGYATSDDTAEAASDYMTSTGTLSFAAGQLSRTFTVPITPDTLDEVDETVALTLTNPTGGATLGSPASATLTIVDDDAPGAPGP